MFHHPRRIALALALAITPVAASAAEITVFAAASLKTALDEIAAGYQAKTGDTLAISYAGSSQLAKQIQEGAPADLFISAAVDWMDKLAETGDIQPDTRFDLLGNTLVLVGHGDAAEIAPADLPATLGDEKLAMALVDSVPAGVYGKAALTSLGLWAAVEPHVAQADNVRAALQLVATGEAPYGIVYASDAVAETGVKVVATFPEDSHVPITYPAALTRSARPEAAAFLAALKSPEAAAVFKAQGFRVLAE